MNQFDREQLHKKVNRIRRVAGVANFLNREGIEIPQKLNEKFNVAIRDKNKQVLEIVRRADVGNDVELMATLQDIRQFI